MKKYLTTAPEPLIAIYEDGGRKIGKETLLRLLTDIDMGPAWASLSQLMLSDRSYDALWREILWALRQANSPIKKRKEVQNEYRNIGSIANTLSSSIESTTLDCRIHRLFPDEVMRINLDRQKYLRKKFPSLSGVPLLEEWPTMVEILTELAAEANRLAENTIGEKRLVERQKGKDSVRSLVFVRTVHEFLKDLTGKNLDSVTARIANAVLLTDLDSRAVRKMTQRTP